MDCFHLSQVVSMNDIKREDAYRVGNDVAIVVDGATGFQKDISSDGTTVPLADITNQEYTSARIWAETLAQSLYEKAQTDSSNLTTILAKSIKEASAKMPLIRSDFASFETPSSPVIVMRVLNGMMEVLGSGDCGLLIKYKDGLIDTFVGSAVLENIRKKREEQIHSLYPDFDSKTKEEQSKIRFYFMKETRQKLGSFPNGYFVPFMNQESMINPFLENRRVVSSNHNRSLNYYQRGDIWELFAEVEKVDTIILSTDGFVERILKNRLATPKMLLNCIKGPTHLKQFAKKLRKVEISSLSNKETIAMKLLNGCKKNTGSADDATALLGYMRVNKHRAFLARQNRLPAIKERD